MARAVALAAVSAPIVESVTAMEGAAASMVKAALAAVDPRLVVATVVEPKAVVVKRAPARAVTESAA